MTDVLLPILPAPSPELLATLRAAKAMIDTDIKVRPVEALPEMGDVVILNFGVWPIPWARDTIFIRPESTTEPERVAAALRHWIDGGAPTYTAADILTLWMGCTVEQVEDEFRLGNAEYNLEQQRLRMRPS